MNQTQLLILCEHLLAIAACVVYAGPGDLTPQESVEVALKMWEICAGPRMNAEARAEGGQS